MSPNSISMPGMQICQDLAQQKAQVDKRKMESKKDNLDGVTMTHYNTCKVNVATWDPSSCKSRKSFYKLLEEEEAAKHWEFQCCFLLQVGIDHIVKTNEESKGLVQKIQCF